MGGALITLEGIDGSGKSTLAAALVAARPGLTLLREPGGVALAERLRAVVMDPALEVGPRAEALIYAAARAQLVAERLRPLLDAGRDVLLDRFVDSSLAYQGGGRALGLAAVASLNAFATDGLVPDRTLLLALDPGVARARADVRRGGAGAVPADRLEREDLAFSSRIAATYAALAQDEPARWRVLDATLKPEALLLQALAVVDEVLGTA